MKKDNKGYSLIELIVIIAIIMVIASMAVMSTGIVTKARQRKAIRSIYTAVGQTRVSTLARDDCWMEIWKDSDGTYVATYDNGALREQKLVAPASITVEYSDDSDLSVAAGSTLGSTHLKCTFSKTSGAVSSSDFYKIKSGPYEMKLMKFTGKCTWN